jgi:hypothetical protein
MERSGRKKARETLKENFLGAVSDRPAPFTAATRLVLSGYLTRMIAIMNANMLY